MLRFVLVPGLTDDPDDVAQIADFAAGLGNVERVDVLPFHQIPYRRRLASAFALVNRAARRPRASAVRRRRESLG